MSLSTDKKISRINFDILSAFVWFIKSLSKLQVDYI